MKHKVIMLILAIAMISTIPMTLVVQAPASTRGPEMDVLRHVVIRSPGPARIAMLGGDADMSPDQIRTTDIEAQAAAGLLVTQDLGFHMGYIAYNIRDTATVNLNRSDRGLPTVSYWPLHDAEFRHALIHSYDQLAIIPPIYGYIVTPVRSLVPPAQSKYYNTAIPAHPFNQGDPFTTSAGDHSSVGILKAKGYTFVDADSSGTVTDADYWKMPNGDPLPKMIIWTPLFGDAPTSFEHGAEFVADLNAIGLAATTSNGDKGLINEGRAFSEYLDDVYGTGTTMGGNFDSYMVFHGMGRLPSQLYEFLHSSQDPRILVGGSNGPGVNNGTMDALVETIKFSLDTDDIEAAAKEAQAMLYTPDKAIYPDADDFALSYMLLYSRSYFNVFSGDLEGVVKSPGYGSDNSWTFLAANWKAGVGRWEDAYGDSALESVMIYINGLPPSSLNPTFMSEAYEWNIGGQVLDGLTAVNPYNHYDIPWIATDWVITETSYGMDIDFTIRSDVKWQDGYSLTASDAEFCLEFYRDWNTFNFAESHAVLNDVIVTSPTTFTVNASQAGLSLFYDYAGSAILLPPQIWNRAWADSDAVTNYQPDAYAYGTDMAPGYSAGPTPPPTNLFGTGPFIFQNYDPVNEVDDMFANRDYFLTQGDIATLMQDMFWEVGDYSKDGIVNVIDLTFVSFAFGNFIGDPDYDPDADFNSDGFVGIKDVSNSAFHLLWQREYSA